MNWCSKRFRNLCTGLFVYVSFITALPVFVAAEEPFARVPAAEVPSVKAPTIENLPAGSVPGGAYSSAADIFNRKRSAASVREIVGNMTKMTLGTRNALIDAAVKTDVTGHVRGGGWKAAGNYAFQLMFPWMGMVPFDDAEMTSDGIDLARKGMETYRAVTDFMHHGIPLTTGPWRTMGPAFPIFGGIFGIVNGSWEVFESFDPTNGPTDHERAGAFYSGAGEAVSGAGMLLAGLTAAGVITAPGIAAAATVLLVAGLAFSIIGFGLKYVPQFQESRPGRVLTDFKNRIGAWGERLFG